MNTIERKLITLMLPEVNITLIEEIVNATPNPSLATEILCGLYVEPTLPSKVWDGDKLYTMDKYDKWGDQVHYSYEIPKTETYYFPEGTKESAVNKDNYLELKCGYADNAVRYTIVFDEIVKKTSYESQASWMKYHAKKPYVAQITEELINSDL